MKTLLCLCLVFCASLQAFGDEPSDETKALNGVWLPVTAELAGVPMPDAVLKTITLKMDNGKYEVSVAGELDKGVYRVNATVNPKTVTVTGMAGPNAGKIFPAIYDLQGETLRVCYDLSGAGRPKEFKTAAGTQYYLVTYHRKSD